LSAQPKRGKRTLTPNQLKMLHTAKSKVGISDDDWELVKNSFGVKSSKDFTCEQFDQILAHFVALGFVPRKPYQTSRGKLQKKVTALLAEMKLPDSYADAIAKQMFGVTRVAWCTPQQLHKIVAALEYRRQRGCRER